MVVIFCFPLDDSLSSLCSTIYATKVSVSYHPTKEKKKKIKKRQMKKKRS